MATFEEHIEGLTQIDIGASTSPSTSHLTEILKNAVVITVNNIITLKPKELSKFTSTTEHTSYVERQGQILSVAREHDSTSILRPATPINPSLRIEATDKDSLNYRSKYNPGFYELDGKIYVVPAAGGGNNDIVVTQVNYDTGIAAGDDYLSGTVDNFPTDYEPLLVLHASAMLCNAKAIEINNNMPTTPTAPISPDFSIENVIIPELPIFNLDAPKFSTSRAISAIVQEDFDKADKFLTLFDKNIESYAKQFELEKANYDKELEVYKSDLDNLSKNADRKTKVELDEYTKELELYTTELQYFKSDLEEAAVQYKWYSSQYISFMNQYNVALGVKPQKPKPQKQSRKEEE